VRDPGGESDVPMDAESGTDICSVNLFHATTQRRHVLCSVNLSHKKAQKLMLCICFFNVFHSVEILDLALSLPGNFQIKKKTQEQKQGEKSVRKLNS
jgi:hypothetical protein